MIQSQINAHQHNGSKNFNCQNQRRRQQAKQTIVYYGNLQKQNLTAATLQQQT
jgi:hypothetical protein